VQKTPFLNHSRRLKSASTVTIFLEKHMHKVIIADVRKCMACRTCEIVCAWAHSKSGTLEEAMKGQPRVNVEAAQDFAIPMLCRHCEDAPCIRICPTGALHRQDLNGSVLIDQDLCIGCKLCLIVCPFGTIVPSYDGRTVLKCDLCQDRLEAGKEPACVVSCPMLALKFVEADQYVQQKRMDATQCYIDKIGN